MSYGIDRRPSGGRGKGGGRRPGGGRGQGGKIGMGSGGWCVCTACGQRAAHQRGETCNQKQCSSCGERMIRDIGTQGFPQQVNSRTSNPMQSSFQRFKIPIVDEGKCVGCSLCLSSCRYNAIHMVNGKAHIQENLCQGCKACIPSCPHGAIS